MTYILSVNILCTPNTICNNNENYAPQRRCIYCNNLLYLRVYITNNNLYRNIVCIYIYIWINAWVYIHIVYSRIVITSSSVTAAILYITPEIIMKFFFRDKQRTDGGFIILLLKRDRLNNRKKKKTCARGAYICTMCAVQYDRGCTLYYVYGQRCV